MICLEGIGCFTKKQAEKIDLVATPGTTFSSPLSLLGLADALPAIISDLLHLSGMRPLTQESSKSFCPILIDQKLLGTNKNLYGSSSTLYTTFRVLYSPLYQAAMQAYLLSTIEEKSWAQINKLV